MTSNEEEGVLGKMDSLVVIPASITIIPDLYHQGTGSVEVASYEPAEPSVQNSYYMTTAWRILAPLEIDLQTSWSVGESGYYWYRVEGECGSVTCDRMGVLHRNCNRMTFITTVSARSLDELCDTLTNPRVNAPVDLKVKAIQRYSRPMFRNQITPGQCNELQPIEFCHIPECMDFCEDRPSGSPLLDSVLEASAAKDNQEGAPQVAPLTHDEDVLVASGSMSAVAFDMGYEYDAEASIPVAEPPTQVVAACGCSNVGLSISVRHSLGRSSRVARFLGSNGLVLPETVDLLHKAAQSSWNHVSHLRGPDEYWTFVMELGCQTDLWRLSLSVKSDRRQTRLVVDIPAELVCRTAGPSGLVECYFDTSSSGDGSGKRIQVVSPPRAETFAAASAAEVYFGGIFVPHTVYYDELGIFDDSFWDYSPLEIALNPVARNASMVMSLDGII